MCLTHCNFFGHLHVIDRYRLSSYDMLISLGDRTFGVLSSYYMPISFGDRTFGVIRKGKSWKLCLSSPFDIGSNFIFSG